MNIFMYVLNKTNWISVIILFLHAVTTYIYFTTIELTKFIFLVLSLITLWSFYFCFPKKYRNDYSINILIRFLKYYNIFFIVYLLKDNAIVKKYLFKVFLTLCVYYVIDIFRAIIYESTRHEFFTKLMSELQVLLLDFEYVTQNFNDHRIECDFWKRELSEKIEFLKKHYKKKLNCTTLDKFYCFVGRKDSEIELLKNNAGVNPAKSEIKESHLNIEKNNEDLTRLLYEEQNQDENIEKSVKVSDENILDTIKTDVDVPKTEDERLDIESSEFGMSNYRIDNNNNNALRRQNHRTKSEGSAEYKDSDKELTDSVGDESYNALSDERIECFRDRQEPLDSTDNNNTVDLSLESCMDYVEHEENLESTPLSNPDFAKKQSDSDKDEEFDRKCAIANKNSEGNYENNAYCRDYNNTDDENIASKFVSESNSNYANMRVLETIPEENNFSRDEFLFHRLLEEKDAIVKGKITKESLSINYKNPEAVQMIYRFITFYYKTDVNWYSFLTTMVQMQKERDSLYNSIIDCEQLFLHFNLLLYALEISFMIALIVLAMKTRIAVVSITVSLFIFTFFPSFKKLCESFLFVISNHPFDCGDRIYWKGENLVVKQITLFHTQFTRWDGTYVVLNNMILAKSSIYNAKRSKNQKLEISFRIMSKDNVKMTCVEGKFDKELKNSMYRIKSYLFCIDETVDSVFTNYRVIVTHENNFQNGFFMWKTHNDYVLMLKKFLEEEKIEFCSMDLWYVQLSKEAKLVNNVKS